MLSDLINPPNSSNNSNNSSSKMPGKGKNTPKSSRYIDPATAIHAIPATGEMPSRRELDIICQRAASDFPTVDPARLRRFIEVAEDPAWCSERVARHLARRMHQGLIREGES